MAAAALLTYDPDGDLLLRLPYPAEKAEGREYNDGAAETETLVDDASVDRMDGAVTPEGLDETMEEAGTSTAGEIHMVVSSKHLMLASRVFRAMLQHSNFKEGDELRKNGRVEVTLPDDNYIAFGIMMDIIHGRVSKIPRQVSLEILTDISILVDKYETLESFGLILDVWMTSLLPTVCDQGVLSWLSIAWVFRLPDCFQKMTRLLQYAADDTAKQGVWDHLPIPDRVFEEIESRRQRAIKDALGHLEAFIDSCRSPLGLCTQAQGSQLSLVCNGMLLGTFLRSASLNGIWPTPAYPYNGLKVLEVTKRIRSLDIKSICDNDFGDYTDWCPSQPPVMKGSHGWKDKVAKQMKVIEKGLSGLELDLFLPPPSQQKCRDQ
ncbi:hypothetical protein BKA64DRAFT_752558 [Cadophora sp. MPI-SDFR-AT-0126]|nr:hypothetical protein BKA64DRAFT_752558 [Leotiomycetes sp. MPI-SDFR-AT-0126]